MQSQPLEQLPRAERLLKNFVDLQVNQLIAHSDAVSNKYLASRQEYIAKSKCSPAVMAAIATTLTVMESALSLPLASRELIPDVQGMSTEEIVQKVEQLKQLIELFRKEEGDQPGVELEELDTQNSPEQLEQQASVADLRELPHQISSEASSSSLSARKKSIGPLIQILEGVCCGVAALAIACFLLKHI